MSVIGGEVGELELGRKGAIVVLQRYDGVELPRHTSARVDDCGVSDIVNKIACYCLSGLSLNLSLHT